MIVVQGFGWGYCPGLRSRIGRSTWDVQEENLGEKNEVSFRQRIHQTPLAIQDLGETARFSR